MGLLAQVLVSLEVLVLVGQLGLLNLKWFLFFVQLSLHHNYRLEVVRHDWFFLDHWLYLYLFFCNNCLFELAKEATFLCRLIWLLLHLNLIPIGKVDILPLRMLDIAKISALVHLTSTLLLHQFFWSFDCMSQCLW